MQHAMYRREAQRKLFSDPELRHLYEKHELEYETQRMGILVTGCPDPECNGFYREAPELSRRYRSPRMTYLKADDSGLRIFYSGRMNDAWYCSRRGIDAAFYRRHASSKSSRPPRSKWIVKGGCSGSAPLMRVNYMGEAEA